ncbi:hypothetical protein PSM_A1593 [Pseudoalteromonas sp. SM9913]|nr:hypothetical protein PSM_A1593 [Pseudoalteromonas sp. SM9913]
MNFFGGFSTQNIQLLSVLLICKKIKIVEFTACCSLYIPAKGTELDLIK